MVQLLWPLLKGHKLKSARNMDIEVSSALAISEDLHLLEGKASVVVLAARWVEVVVQEQVEVRAVQVEVCLRVVWAQRGDSSEERR